MTELFTNNASTQLAAGISSSATTIILTTGTGALFPNPSAGQFFSLTLNDAATGAVYEITYCTARTGDSCTVIRGEEGTTARAWLIGDYAYNAITAGTLELLTQHGQVYISSSETWTCPAGVSYPYVDLYGAGGGGEGTNGGSGGGGGYAGGYVNTIPGNSYSIVIGAGGAAGTGSGGGNGGTTTAFGLTATGGEAGTAAGGIGGSGSGGTTNLTGQGGTDLTDNGTGYATGIVGNALGGNCAGPGGGAGGNINQSAAGIPATAPGGGGGSNSAGSLVAQAGAPGAVRITW